MKMILCLSALLAGAALADPPRAWEPIAELPGTDYVGRSDANGQLVVSGWSIDGGIYVDDGLHAIAFISSANRIGIMTDAFRKREADGAAAWTVKAAMSFTAERASTYIETNCGVGADFDPGAARTEYVVGIVPMNAEAKDGLVTRLYGAARVDLKTGTIQPIDPTGIYCHQEELN
jgi:hypothetical protein